ncbi:MAG: ACT domain-containing protein [Pseudomonadota bacterium]
MAEKDLDTLLDTLDVYQHEGVWAFKTAADCPGDTLAMAFREREGWTVIEAADLETESENRWAWLELTVVSDLNAIGFLARISKALADAGIPCNAVAGFYHDHIFVPEAKATDAVSALRGLSSRAGAVE